MALIHSATTPLQETVTARLADFIDPETAPALPAPVVTVIGDVVALRAQLGIGALDKPASLVMPSTGTRVLFGV